MKKIATAEQLEILREQYKKTIEERSLDSGSEIKYIMVCGETGCRTSGCLEVIKSFEKAVSDCNISDKVKVIATGCSGICELGPIAVIYPEGILYTNLTASDPIEIIKTHFIGSQIIERLLYKNPKTNKPIPMLHQIPFFKSQYRLVRKNAGVIDPENIYDYIGSSGYEGAAKVLFNMSPSDVIEEIEKSGLRGRGGGGFPTGLKWKLSAEEKSSEKYIICNADEGDPGAFMDRSQLEGDPHSVIEGMMIAGYAIGAETGIVYCRAEYPLAIERLETAIKQSRDCGLLGENILDSGFSFDIEIRMGAGAFVCGEETALIASIEGKRGEPVPKPPFPAKEGVWKKPTVVNNVETFANIPQIIRQGASEFSKLGTDSSRGTKIFALAGAVKNVGLIEVPMGITLGEIIYDIGGGIIDNKEFKAVQIGGPSGGCLPANLLNTPIEYESLKAAGAMMGSGGLIVMSQDTCMVDLAKFFLEFIQDESCGKCPPCRIGTKRMLEILERISEGRGRDGDIEELLSLGEDIKVSAICGLGQTAPNPVISTIRNFRSEYEEHIKHKRCPAGVCSALVYAPCHNACPAGVNVPAFIAYTSKGMYEKALSEHIDRNPFPMACGLTCTHPCESKCRRQTLDAPLAIREIKRFMTEKGGFEGKYPMPEIMKRPVEEVKNIAVIGSGPCGLTAAFFLKRLGHNVTVFESQEKPGGMMRYGIPEYRYPRLFLIMKLRIL